MKNWILLLLFLPTFVWAQEEGLPRHLTPEEMHILRTGEHKPPVPAASPNIFTAPPSKPIRSMAEWEEMEAIVVTWTQYKFELSKIIEAAQEECRVIVVTNNVANAQAELQGTYGVVPNSNTEFVLAPYNSIWVRDYGANPAYLNDVDSLVLVDWIYNRFRFRDDTMAVAIADHFELPLYSMTEAPYDLVNTGGNYMSDGMGQGFSSDLVLDENLAGNPWGASPKDEAGVAAAMDAFLGIDPYILMEKLPYDGIHHIDMHMKLLDEETLIVGQFPEGISDGPQIEANIQYVINNFETAYGKDFNIIRIPQPPCGNGSYPPFCSNTFEYRTYVNSMIVNNSILVPVYGTSLDDEALAIWEENMPGYNVVGINCTNIINAGGAIHCITKEVGVRDPLWISTARIDTACDQEIKTVTAIMEHRSGIAEAQLFYTTDLNTGYTAIAMSPLNDSLWTADLPPFPQGTQVYYYLSATANSGKSMTRPLVAPEGHWTYEVGSCSIVSTQETPELRTQLHDIFPNPARAITAVPVSSEEAIDIKLEVIDLLGRSVEVLHEGRLPAGKEHFFIHADRYQPGVYMVVLETEKGKVSKRLMVEN